MKRLFIAFDIVPAPETLEALQIIQRKMRLESIRWVPFDNFHLTLKFLGNTDTGKISGVTGELKKTLGQFSAFTIKLQGLGVFKNLRDPRILWMGCQGGTALYEIKQAVENALGNAGFAKDDRSFNPHLTIGRITQIRNSNQLTEALAIYRDKVFQQDRIKEFILYESILSPDGSVYIPVDRFSL